MQPTNSNERKYIQTDAKTLIMETTDEKIQAGLKSEHSSVNNPFFNFENTIKNIDNQNFVVEWQVGVKEKSKLTDNLASAFFLF